MAQASSSNARRVQRRRDKLRSQGMRPLQIWVPDTRAPGFAEEAVRQARVVAETRAWFDAHPEEARGIVEFFAPEATA